MSINNLSTTFEETQSNMKSKLFYVLIGLLFILLTIYQNDSNWKSTRELKATIGEYQEAESLSGGGVTAFAQDKALRMWIGTDNGLNIFFGNDYKQLFYDAEDTTTIPDNSILSLLCDSEGSMWVSTPSGIAKHIGCYKFRRYNVPITNQGTYQLAEYGDNGMLVSNGSNVYLIKGDNISKFFHIAEPSLLFATIHPDSEGGFWIVNAQEAVHYDKAKKQTFSTGKGSSNLSYTYQHGDTLWYTQSHNVHAIDMKANKIIYSSKELPIIPTSICPKNKDLVLINSSFHGLYSIDLRTDQLTKLTENDFHLRNEDETIATMYRDKEDNLWLGYQYGGFQVSPNAIVYEKLNNLPINNLTRGQAITCLGLSNNHIIGSTGSKVFCYGTKNKAFTQYMYKEIFTDSPFFRQTLENIVPYEGDKLWLISNVRIISCEIKDDKIQVLNRVFSPTHHGPALGKGICLGSDILVTTTSSYLLRSRFGTDVCDSIYVDNKKYNKESLLQKLPNGKVLVITEGMNMLLFNPKNNQIEHFNVQQPAHTENADPSIVFIDDRRRIWIGTRQNGLFSLNYDERKLENVGFVPFASIQDIIEDNGQLWISSQEELLSLNPNDTTLHLHSSLMSQNKNGSHLFYKNCCRLTGMNSLIFGTSNGCVTIPLVDAKNEGQYKLSIHSLQIDAVGGQKIGVCKFIENGDHLTFSHDENNIELEFANVNYGNRERLMYQYKLEGVDKNWSVPTLHNKAKYTQLSPGNYTFRVRLITSQNHAALSECELRLTIKPNFWLSYVAIYFYIICVLAALYYIQYIIISRQKERLKLKQLEDERLREKRNNEMNMSFFANISHEFRNPLTLISGPLIMLKYDHVLPLAAQKTINTICININRMLMLIDQMLDFNKLESDALRLEVAQDDIVCKLQNMVTMFIESARFRGIQVSLDKKEENMYVWMDNDKIDKIMSNLFTNALKHTPDNGHIEIGVGMATVDELSFFQNLHEKDNQPYLCVRVHNNGNQIDDDKIADIFKRYYQVKGTQATHRYGWGTGIGLYYVKRLVELHHGQIRVQNDPEGGVSFIFVLPTDESFYNHDERASQEENMVLITTEPISNEIEQKIEVNQIKVNETAKKPVILVVDDDIAVAQYTRSLFVDNYVVVNKYSAESALEEIGDIKPDIVLSDVIMGTMTGYEFCKKIKADLMTCHIPVVLITAKANVNEQVEGLEYGANAYVTKPFDPRYLKAVVSSLLNNVHMLREKLAAGDNEGAISEDLSKQDRDFMDSLYELMKKHISEQDLNVSTISQELLISQSKFNYKLKELTGETPGSFFRKYKLNVAAKLLREGKNNVSEVAYMTGFGTASYFSVAFKKQFGISPSEYQ